LVRANEDRTLRAFGHAIVVLLDGKQTNGKFTAFLNMNPPGCGPRLHYHDREDEWFYIIEGRVSSFITGTWTTRGPMKPESRPSGEQGLTSAVDLAGTFDHEFTQTPLAKHAPLADLV
jgi:hypothetical protein